MASQLFYLAFGRSEESQAISATKCKAGANYPLLNGDTDLST